MAAKKTASKKTTSSKKSARKAPAKATKPRFYATANRLFAASLNGGLPKGSYVLVNPNTPGGINTQVRIGTQHVCVFEGTLLDLLTGSLGKQKLKVRTEGSIPSPATPAPATTTTPAL